MTIPFIPTTVSLIGSQGQQKKKMLVQILVIPIRFQSLMGLLPTDHERPQEIKGGCVPSEQPGKLLNWGSKEENKPQTQ